MGRSDEPLLNRHTTTAVRRQLLTIELRNEQRPQGIGSPTSPRDLRGQTLLTRRPIQRYNGEGQGCEGAAKFWCRI